MVELRMMDDFLMLSLEERKSYLLEIAELEDFWLIGSINNPADDKPFFFINHVINPYTGFELVQALFADKGDRIDVFCALPSNAARYKNDTLVAVKVKMTDDKKLKQGKIFTTTYKDVYIIEDNNELLNLINKSELDLPIIALAKPAYYQRSEGVFEKIDEILKKKLEKELEAIQAENDAVARTKREAELKLRVAIEKEESLKIETAHLQTLSTQLQELGFSFEEHPNSSSETIYLDVPEKPSQLLQGIQAQLKARGFQYESRFLRQLMLSLTTGQMIILTGPSGTGKTTIVKQLADVVNAKYEIIPVQPSWTDKQDLLGFYNPIRKLYVPSPFLDCLLEAAKYPEQLYFICLDEMNLAQIEYYLADLLSIRELEDAKLRLYSDFEYQQNMDELGWFVQKLIKSEESLETTLQHMQLDTFAHFEMTARFQNLKRYQPKIEIPSNVRIIGTMNVDGAVQAVSPKVVDRSFVIPVARQQKEDVTVTEQIGSYNIHPKNFEVAYDASKNISTQLRSAMNALQVELANFHIGYNERVEKHIRQYYLAASQFDINTKQQVDDLTVMKLLPRVHEQIEQDHMITSLIKTLEAHVGSEPMARFKIKQMQDKMRQIGLFSYWS